MLLVVRHGDAGDKGSWEGPDLLRPLSPSGRRQAEGLVVRLEDFPVERILSSPTLRCRQTVEPLARDRFLKVEPLAALGVEASPAQVLAVFWSQALRHAVLCSHGETIGRLLTQLLADGLVVEDPLDWPKGSTRGRSSSLNPEPVWSSSFSCFYAALVTIGDGEQHGG